MTKHINPGTDTTINPVVIDDSYRERKQKVGHCNHECVCMRYQLASPIAYKDGTRCMANQEGCKSCPNDSRSHTPAHPPEAQQRIDAAIRKIQCQSEIARNCGLQERYEGMQEAIALLQAGRK